VLHTRVPPTSSGDGRLARLGDGRKRVTGYCELGCWMSTPVRRHIKNRREGEPDREEQLRTEKLITANFELLQGSPFTDRRRPAMAREPQSPIAGHTSRDVWSAIEHRGSPSFIALGGSVNGLPCKSSESAEMSVSVMRCCAVTRSVPVMPIMRLPASLTRRQQGRPSRASPSCSAAPRTARGDPPP